MHNFKFLYFVAMTFTCWGLYGPLLHMGQNGMISAGEEHLGKGSLRPFICVGIAYFLIAVLFPLFKLSSQKETGNWSTTGVVWSFFAGIIGAIGALGIVLAFKFKGSPVFVMPLVFGCAPVVNTFVTMLMSRTIRNASVQFFVGIGIVATGAAGVLVFKPHADASKKVSSTVSEIDSDTNAETNNKSSNSSETNDITGAKLAEDTGNIIFVFASIIVTAICWGAYGPVLHKGQTSMKGSRLRPFLCVGIAYFAVAVIGPYFLLPLFEEPSWNFKGTVWSLMAGAVGALGALGIIYAFNFGGKPIFVMPLVFGFAPVVNTLTEITKNDLFSQISSMFYMSLGLVILGAVTVLVCAPKGTPKDTPKQSANEPEKQSPDEPAESSSEKPNEPTTE